MRLYFEFVWGASRDRFDKPVTTKLLEELFSGILYNHITENAHDTYVTLSPEADFGRVDYRVAIGENIRRLFSIDKDFVNPLIGLSLHLGGLPCDRTSYTTLEEVEFHILALFNSEFYKIPVQCRLNKGLYETVRLQFYRATKGGQE